MAGKPQKPVAALVGHRRPNRAALAVVDDADRPRIPTVPRREDGEPLAAPVRALWRRMWRSRVAAAWDVNGDLPVLTRWAQTLDLWIEVSAAVRGRAMVRGSMGQKVANPLFQVRAGLERDLVAIERSMGLNALDRMRLGVEGAAMVAGVARARTAADRAPAGAPADPFPTDGWEVANDG